MIAILLAGLSLAEDASPREALLHELQRAMTELALPDAPTLYHLRYHLLELEQVDIEASFGSLVHRNEIPYNGLGVEVRVGTEQFDNTGFGGWQDGFSRANLPMELTAQSLRLDAWRLTDRSYKQAVEQFARKQAQFTPPEDYPGDYTLTTSTIADLGGANLSDADDLQALALRLSEVLAGSTPPLLLGEVHVGHEAGQMWTIDSEGTDVTRPLHETSIRAIAQIRTEDGAFLTDAHLWSARDTSGLPDPTAMVQTVRDLRDHLVGLAAAPSFSEEYVGPVVFTDTAAVHLFRYLLVSQLEGTPAEIPFDSFFGELGLRGGSVRLDRRVLPPGWTVTDDPTRLPDHPGSFTHDFEGTPAQPVTLVEDGIVKDVLMCRVPRRDRNMSNGHARGFLGNRPSGRTAALLIEPPRHLSQRALIQRGLRLARAYGRDHVLVIDRLQEPAILERGRDFWYDQDEHPLPPPVSVRRVYADGHEEVQRGVRFASADRWLLRDLIAAGPEVEATWLAPILAGWGGLSPTEGLPTWTGAAEVLVGEVELVPAPGDPMEVPILPPPSP